MHCQGGGVSHRRTANLNRASVYRLNNKGQLRRVVELWEDLAKPDENLSPKQEAAAHSTLQAVFSGFGEVKQYRMPSIQKSNNSSSSLALDRAFRVLMLKERGIIS